MGNPGRRYASTRHNIGAWVVDRLAARLGARLRKVRFLALEAGDARTEGSRLWLARPTIFMNESGPPASSFARKRGIPPDRVVACHDDIDLGLGALKLKRGGSTAGHRGLDSLVRALRTQDFVRVRLGVGRPPGRKDPVDHVLEPFAATERAEAEILAEEGADAVLTLVQQGLAVAQDRHNRAAP